MKTQYFIILAFSILTLSSCKKDDKSSDILVSKTWKRALTDKNPATNPAGTVIYYAVQNCEKDNTFKFGTNGHLTLKKGSEKCDPNELETETQAYALNRATKEFSMNGIKFTLAEESNGQIKYYAPLAPPNDAKHIIFLLQ